MLLYEHEGKTLFREYGIPTPEFVVIEDMATLDKSIVDIRTPAMVKAQALTGGRGKAGGIVVAGTLKEMRDAAKRLLGSKIKDWPVDRVLIEPQARIERELYLGLTLDGEDIVLLIGTQGGVDVESYFTDRRDGIVVVRIDPLLGLSEYQVRNALDRLGIATELWGGFARVAIDLYRLFWNCDATLAEINPLAVTAEGNLIALDARVEIDENALFRQQHLKKIQGSRGRGQGFEAQLNDLQIQYVPMGGSIGLVSQGAGAGVTIMDWVDLEGSRVAAFVDMDYAILSGRAEEGLRHILTHFADNPKVLSVIVNFTTCGVRLDLIAETLTTVLAELRGRLRQPVFLHLQGNRAEAAHSIMRRAGHDLCATLGDAVRGACRAAQKEKVA